MSITLLRFASFRYVGICSLVHASYHKSNIKSEKSCFIKRSWIQCISSIKEVKSHKCKVIMTSSHKWRDWFRASWPKVWCWHRMISSRKSNQLDIVSVIWEPVINFCCNCSDCRRNYFVCCSNVNNDLRCFQIRYIVYLCIQGHIVECWVDSIVINESCIKTGFHSSYRWIITRKSTSCKRTKSFYCFWVAYSELLSHRSSWIKAWYWYVWVWLLSIYCD